MPAITIHYDDNTQTTLPGVASLQIDVGTAGYTHATKGVQKVVFDLDAEAQARIDFSLSDPGVPAATWSVPFSVGRTSPLVLTWSTQAALTSVRLRIPAQTNNTYSTFFFLGTLDDFVATVGR